MGQIKYGQNLILTTREGVLAGGEVGPAVDLENPSASLMLQMVSYKDEDHQMPPIGKLPQNKIDALGKWIEMGLPFPKEDEIEPKNVHSHASTTEVNEYTKSHWAYKKPTRRLFQIYLNMQIRSIGSSMLNLLNKTCQPIHLLRTIP